MKHYRQQSGWVLIYTLAMSVVLFVVVLMTQNSVLEMETEIQMQQSNMENDRLSRAALLSLEEMLRQMTIRPTFIGQNVKAVNVAKGDEWVVQSKFDAMPPLQVEVDPLTHGRALHWWEQPLSWWTKYAYRFVFPFTTKPDQRVDVFVVQGDPDSYGMDLSANTLYAVNPQVLTFEIYVRAQSGKGAARRKMSTFSRAFY